MRTSLVQKKQNLDHRTSENLQTDNSASFVRSRKGFLEGIMNTSKVLRLCTEILRVPKGILKIGTPIGFVRKYKGIPQDIVKYGKPSRFCKEDTTGILK